MTLDEVKQLLIAEGFEDSILFDNPSYETAIVGISTKGEVIYRLDLMIEYLTKEFDLTIVEAIEFIENNTLNTLYADLGGTKPIVMKPILD